MENETLDLMPEDPRPMDFDAPQDANQCLDADETSPKPQVEETSTDNRRREREVLGLPTNDEEYDQQKDILCELCSELSIKVSDDQAEMLIRYLMLMMRRNKVLNLTAIKEWDKALVLHIVDSLTLLKEFKSIPQQNFDRPFLDMGTGAGLPGIPLGIMCPNRKGVLCDATKKKIDAVRDFLYELHMLRQLKPVNERLEILGKKNRREYGCIVVRAVAQIPVLIEYATPLLSKRGELIISKGNPTDEEFELGDKVASVCGLELAKTREIELPKEMGHRVIVTYRKVSEPSVALPRAIGLAGKVPLV